MENLEAAVSRILKIINSTNFDQTQSTKLEKIRQTLKGCGISVEELATCKNSEFVQEVVELSLCLCLKIENSLELCNLKDSSFLSAELKNSISILIQFVVKFGICNYLEHNVTGEKPRNEITKSLSKMEQLHLLYKNCRSILQICVCNAMRQIFLLTSLGHLIGALLQLCFSPASARVLEVKERKECLGYLNEVLDTWITKDRVVLETILLQGDVSNRVAPKWLREKCGVMLSRTLMEKGGVKIIIRSMIINLGENTSIQNAGEWKRATALASIISTIPTKYHSAEDYCAFICPQLVEVLMEAKKENNEISQETVRVTVASLHSLVEKYQQACEKHLEPLHTVLEKCCIPKDVNFIGDVSEDELSECLELLHLLCHSFGIPSKSALDLLVLQYSVILFLLICDTRETSSHLSSLAMELLVACLNNADKITASKLVLQLYGEVPQDSTLKIPFTDLSFTSTENGGIIPVCRSTSEPTDILSTQDTKVNVLLEILGQVKVNDIMGEVFIELFQSLCNSTKNSPTQTDNTLSLLTDEDRAAFGLKSNETRLITFALMMSLCENIEPNKLLSNPSQIFSFVKARLLHLNETPAPDDSTLESLKICFSVLGVSMISDLSPEERNQMKSLIPHLQKLNSSKHLDLHTKEIANDLAIAIATYGAASLDSIKLFSKSFQEQAKIISSLSTEREIIHEDNLNSKNTGTPYVPERQRSQNLSTDNTFLKLKKKLIEEIPEPQTNEEIKSEPKDSDLTASFSNENPCNLQSMTNSNAVQNSKNKAGERDKIKKSIKEAIEETFSSEPALCGGAIRYLTKCLQEKIPDSIDRQNELVKIFKDNLKSGDSFVYLSAIQGLHVAVSHSTDQKFANDLLGSLMKDFVQDSIADKGIPIDIKMKVGEVIMRIIRLFDFDSFKNELNAGDLAHDHAIQFLPEMLKGITNENPDMRASCLSNMAELIPLAPYVVVKMQHEISECLCMMAKSDSVNIVRRAAVHTIRKTIENLEKEFLKIFDEEAKTIYKTLKRCYEKDDDTVVQLHAQLALEQLDVVMRDAIFKPPELKKNITVLPM